MEKETSKKTLQEVVTDLDKMFNVKVVENIDPSEKTEGNLRGKNYEYRISNGEQGEKGSVDTTSKLFNYFSVEYENFENGMPVYDSTNGVKCEITNISNYSVSFKLS